MCLSKNQEMKKDFSSENHTRIPKGKFSIDNRNMTEKWNQTGTCNNLAMSIGKLQTIKSKCKFAF